MNIPSLSDIKRAHTRIAKYIYNTPVISNQTFNDLVGGNVYFKCENLQKIGAFKMRGAANVVFSYRPEERVNGFATHSSGNHAQAVAKAASLAGVKAYIVMPENAQPVKIEAVQSYGAEITFCDPTEEARAAACKKVIKKTNAIQIHPYHDPQIIAGQATAAKELIEEHTDLDYLITPVGGGGLAAGSALTVNYVTPSTKLILAEPEEVNETHLSFQSGKKQMLKEGQTSIADGLLVTVGDLNFEIIKRYAHDVQCVTEEEIISAMKFFWERTKIIIEPSSAVAVALLIKNKEQFAGKQTGVILTGGNVQLDQLPF